MVRVSCLLQAPPTEAQQPAQPRLPDRAEPSSRTPMRRPSSAHPTAAGLDRDTARAGFALSTHHVLSALVLLFSAVLLAPRLPHELLRFFSANDHRHATSPAASSRQPAFYKEPLVCPKPSIRTNSAITFNTDTERSMALAEQARRVAAEFDFGPDAVNKAVKEFIREMGMSGRRSALQH